MRARVLVVDDAWSFRRAAAAVVEHTDGFELAGTAASGEDALDQLGHLRADVALVDVNMPGIGGLATARRMATLLPELVVVLVSTYEPADLPDDVRSSGAQYLHKAALAPETLAAAYDTGRVGRGG